MRREIIAHTRDPITEDRLSELAASCGVSLHEVRVLEEKWGYLPHRIVAYGEADALHVFTLTLTYSDLRVGQISVWDGA
jgi:hypothetical protein